MNAKKGTAPDGLKLLRIAVKNLQRWRHDQSLPIGLMYAGVSQAAKALEALEAEPAPDAGLREWHEEFRDSVAALRADEEGGT